MQNVVLDVPKTYASLAEQNDVPLYTLYNLAHEQPSGKGRPSASNTLP